MVASSYLEQGMADEPVGFSAQSNTSPAAYLDSLWNSIVWESEATASQAGDLLFLFRVNGDLLRLTHKARQYLGFTDEFPNRSTVSIEALCHHDDLTHVLHTIMSLSSASSASGAGVMNQREVVIRMVTDFGRYQWMGLKLSLRVDMQGQQFVVISGGIRNGVQESLQCSDELRALGFTVHLSTHAHFRFVSPASLPMVGIPPSCMLGHRFHEYIPIQDLSFFEERWKDALNNDAPVPFNIMFRNSSGAFVPVITSLYFSPAHGGPTQSRVCVCTVGLTHLSSVQPLLTQSHSSHSPQAMLHPVYSEPPHPVMARSGPNQARVRAPFQPDFFQPPSSSSSSSLSSAAVSSAASSSSSLIIPQYGGFDMSELSLASASSEALPLAPPSASSPPSVPSPPKKSVSASPNLAGVHRKSSSSSVTSVATDKSGQMLDDGETSSVSGESDGEYEPNKKLSKKGPGRKPKATLSRRGSKGTSSDGEFKKKHKKKSVYRPSKRTDTCCEFCGKTETPEWRRGPSGQNTLCNACGIKYSKKGLPPHIAERKASLSTSLPVPLPNLKDEVEEEESDSSDSLEELPNEGRLVFHPTHLGEDAEHGMLPTSRNLPPPSDSPLGLHHMDTMTEPPLPYF